MIRNGGFDSDDSGELWIAFKILSLRMIRNSDSNE